jgi:hypothetical protein
MSMYYSIHIDIAIAIALLTLLTLLTILTIYSYVDVDIDTFSYTSIVDLYPSGVVFNTPNLL